MSGIRALALAPDREPWDRQLGQNSNQHAALMAFLRLAPPRRVQKLPEMSNADGEPITGYSVAYLYKLKIAHRWDEIAEAWDRDQHQAFMAVVEAERRKSAIHRLSVGRKMLRLVDGWVDQATLSDITPGAAAQLAGAADRIQRGVFEPEVSRIELTGAHGGPVETADWAALPPAAQAARLKLIADEKRRQAELLAAYHTGPAEEDH